MDTSNGFRTKDLLRTFCEETTAHGLGSIVRESILALRVVWLVVVLGAMAGNVWHLSLVVTHYLSYQTQEITTLSHQPAPFPDVTICGVQPTSSSAFNKKLHTGRLADFLESRHQVLEAVRETPGLDWHLVDNRLHSPVGLFENIGIEATAEIGHARDDFILLCYFSDEWCDAKVMKHFVDPLYFNCYTFQPNSTLNVGAGPQNGLSLVVYLEARSAHNAMTGSVEQLEYNNYSPIENAVGARVVVHGPGEQPQTINSGIDVIAGHSTSLALSVDLHKRQPQPYGYCESAETLQGTQHSYSTDGCLQLCIQNHTYDECGCTSSSLPISDDLEGIPLCGKYDASNVTEYVLNIECEVSIYKKFNSNRTKRDECQCYEPCKHYFYRVSTFASRWPADEYVEDFFRGTVEVPHEEGKKLNAYTQLANYTDKSSTEFVELVHQNFARINIYFSELNVLERSQEPSYQLSHLWSDVGGTIGLWAGLSLITVFECIVFVIKLACPYTNEKGSSNTKPSGTS